MAEAADILADLPRVAEEALSPADLDARLAGADQPFVVRGLAADWPLVRAGLESADAARAYLVALGREAKLTGTIGQPGGGERLFYNAEMGMNFRSARGRSMGF